jgi:hypothetical protein
MQLTITNVGILVLCAAAASATCALAQPAGAPALALTASVDKKQYALGEPVYLSVFLQNTSASPQAVSPSLTTGHGSIEIIVEDPAGKPSGFAPTSVLDSSAPAATLAPKRVTANVIPIFFGARGWTFPSAGRYTVKTTYGYLAQDKASRLAAAPIVLEVTNDPAGSLLVQPAARASQEAGKLLLWMSGDHLRGGAAVLEELMAKYPKSPVASYAALALGRNWARHFLDYGAERVRPPDYQRARAYLKNVRTSELPEYLRVQYQLTQAQVSSGLGDRNAALAQLNSARAAIAKRPELSRLAGVASRVQSSIR